MHCELRKWRLSDAADLAAALSNKEILNNLRDGLPYPYTEQDAAAYITAMISADENSTFAYAITVEGKVVDMRLYALTRPIAPYPVRRLCPEGLPEAVELVWQVFCRFESPEYGPEGTAEFRRILDDASFLRSLAFYGAFDGGELVGVLAMRPLRHISLFFVREDHHRRGIGRALFDAMRRDYDPQVFTVHASPYASEVYRRLGFVPTGPEQVTNGIRYTPMEFAEKGET